MQLEILAPYNNLATSMAAALVPALLVPHQSKSDSKDKPSKFNRIVYSNIIVIQYTLIRYYILFSCENNSTIRSS